MVNDPIKYVEETVYRPYPDHIKAVGYKMVYSEIGGDNIFLQTMDRRCGNKHQIKAGAVFAFHANQL